MTSIITRAFQSDSQTQPAVGSALTIVLPIASTRVTALDTLLNEIGTHINDNEYFDFTRVESAHFLRWVIIPPASATPGGVSQLAFESNYDGSADAHLDELCRVAPGGMHAIYACCTGYPLSEPPLPASARKLLVSFLLGHSLPYAAFYVGVPGAPALQIRHEATIRARIEAYLGDGLHADQADKRAAAQPKALCAGALREVRTDPVLAAALERADDTFPLHPLRLAAGAAAAITALPALVPALLAIRVKELTDDQAPELSISDSARALMAREDLQIQNQLTHVVPLRTGLLRKLSARTVLGAIDFLAHNLFNRGNLGGITSIHFARWFLIDEGTRLVFFSNYDGSWESYLGDFVDKAALGLTAVWSNTENFPKTFLLLFKGATDEERFKAWTRDHQVTTQLWFSAYPELTVKNIINNRKICAELRRGLDNDRAARRWLQRF